MKVMKKLLIITCLVSSLTCTTSIHHTSYKAIFADGNTQSGGYNKGGQKIIEPTSLQIIRAV